MAVTQNTYTGNGSTTNYSFTFPYLETTDIKVSLNGTVTTAYTLANATTIQFNTAPTTGAAIRIYRETDDSGLAATFYPGSAIRSQDLNENFTQNLYVTQESNREASSATSTANTALTNSNTAISTANAATATANTASSNASAAVSTANTASTNASAAVSTANTASTNATAAVNTANSAAADAATAISTANSAVTTANAATATANAASATATTASTNASAAVSTANAATTTAGNAVTTANNAVTTANSAVTTAGNAVTTANNAVTTANSAVSTANSAVTTANAAASAVANAILYDTVANVAAIPATPSNNDAVEVVNSTGIQSFTPLNGLPSGFVGDSGLSVRLIYTTSGNTWNWIQYFPNDPENRYGDAITTLQTDLNAAEADILALDSAKLDATTAASTYLTQANAASTLASINNTSLTGTSLINAAGIATWVRFSDSDASHYIGLQSPSVVTSNFTLTLPATAGAAGQILSTDGTGNLSWVNDIVVLVTDGGNFDNGTSTVSTSQTLDGGQF